MIYQIKPRNPAHSISIQLALFQMGYRWAYGVPDMIQYTDAKFLIFGDSIKWSDVEDPDAKHVTLRYEKFYLMQPQPEKFEF